MESESQTQVEPAAELQSTAEPPSPQQEATRPEPPWRRLHPASILVNLLPHAWRQLRGYWPLLIALFVGSEVTVGRLDLDLVLFLFLFAASQTLIHQLTLRFRVKDGKLEVQDGLLYRRSRILGAERIQSASLLRNPFHRLAGLVEVRIETAGDLRTEGLLSALSVERANELLGELEEIRRQGRSRDEEEDAPPTEEILHEVGLLEILGHGLSSMRAGVFGFLVLVAMEIARQTDPTLAAGLPEQAFNPAFVVGFVFSAFAVGWLLALGGALLSLFRFRLTLQEDLVRAEQGLLTRRRVELGLGRVHVLRIDEPFVRRRMGYGSIFLQTAGIAVGPEGVRAADANIPMIPRARLRELCALFLPGLSLDPWASTRPGAPPFSRAPIRVLLLGLLGASLQSFAAGLVALWLLGPWGLLIACLLWPLLLLGAWLDWSWQTWAVDHHVLISRRGFWSRQTWILPREKVQSMVRIQDPFLRVLGLGRVVVRMASARVVLPIMRWSDAGELLDCAERERPD